MVKLLRRKTTSVPLTPKIRLFRITRLLIALIITLYPIFSFLGLHYYTSYGRATTWDTTPTTYGLAYDTVSFKSALDDQTVEGWFVPAPGQKVVLGLHGNGGNRQSLVEKAELLAHNGYNVLLIDLHRPGLISDSASSLGYYEQRQAQGALDYLKQRGFQSDHIGILGESLGAAVGLLLMGSNPAIKAMVSDSAFADLGQEIYESYAGNTAVNFLLPGMLVEARLLRGVDINQVRPAEAVKKLQNQRLLLIHGDQDRTINLRHFEQLKAVAGDKAQSWLVKGADHLQASVLYPQEYNRRVLALFQQEL